MQVWRYRETKYSIIITTRISAIKKDIKRKETRSEEKKEDEKVPTPYQGTKSFDGVDQQSCQVASSKDLLNVVLEIHRRAEPDTASISLVPQLHGLDVLPAAQHVANKAQYSQSIPLEHRYDGFD